MSKVIAKFNEIHTTVEKVSFGDGKSKEIIFDLKTVDNLKQVIATADTAHETTLWEYDVRYIVDPEGDSDVILLTSIVLDKYTNFTLAREDLGNWLRVHVPLAGDVVTVTVPLEDSAAHLKWSKYGEVIFQQKGAGSVVFEGADGVNVNRLYRVSNITQHDNAVVSLKSMGTDSNEWTLYGALEDV